MILPGPILLSGASRGPRHRRCGGGAAGTGIVGPPCDDGVDLLRDRARAGVALARDDWRLVKGVPTGSTARAPRVERVAPDLGEHMARGPREVAGQTTMLNCKACRGRAWTSTTTTRGDGAMANV